MTIINNKLLMAQQFAMTPQLWATQESKSLWRCRHKFGVRVGDDVLLKAKKIIEELRESEHHPHVALIQDQLPLESGAKVSL